MRLKFYPWLSQQSWWSRKQWRLIGCLHKLLSTYLPLKTFWVHSSPTEWRSGWTLVVLHPVPGTLWTDIKVMFYTIYLSLCTQSADPNPFRGTACSISLKLFSYSSTSSSEGFIFFLLAKIWPNVGEKNYWRGMKKGGKCIFFPQLVKRMHIFPQLT